MTQISRRDFLKMVGNVSSGALFSAMHLQTLSRGARTDSNLPNVIIILLDAMTAENLSVYGYFRKTTPNFERFASHSTVYHNHYSSGNFTVPGTASLLTGLYPWTHRAINISGLVKRELVDRNIYTQLGQLYHRFAFTQNIAVNHLLNQFDDSIETYLQPGEFSLIEHVPSQYLVNDKANAYRALEKLLTTNEDVPSSLLWGTLNQFVFRRSETIVQAAAKDYPQGLPNTRSGAPIIFRLQDVFQGIRDEISELESPYFAYFHLWPPHSPYRPTKEFSGIFAKGMQPKKKPVHLLGDGVPQSHLNTRRMHYDEYIANADSEFGNLIDQLKEMQVLDNSYVILTSDHGESFERGVDGHITPLLYEPLVHIPLIVSIPGQQERQDVYTPTSSVDILPTLLNISGTPVPDWCEGYPLPRLGGVEQPDRSVFSVEAKLNPSYAPLTTVSVMLRKGRYKLTLYRGYKKDDIFELYDLEDDREELSNLYNDLDAVAKPMQDELLASLEASNSKYQ